jgi:hypothetical protein
MGLFSFGSIKLPIKKTFRLKRLKAKKWEVLVGQKLKMWLNERERVVNVYAKHSSGGEGLVATIDDSTIYKALDKFECYADTNVKYVDDKEIDLEVHLHD